ncbi:MAG: CHAT domain-containing protein [Moorea sp. SIO2B7]|nr:CHAT domain-containing protein [Moorena sp. SIO2B7]
MFTKTLTKYSKAVIEKNTTDYRKDAQELYDLLIKPLEAELKAQKIDTLLFSMGTKLELFSFAALYDGKQFLVENYRLSLIPSFRLADTHYKELHNPQVLAMGISKFSDKPSLPTVPMEISTITQLWQGKSFLNEKVTLENIKVQRQKPFEIIHLATHAKFNEQIQEKYWIQLWDKKLIFDDLRQLKLYKYPKVKLLVLSACETALGDKYAEMGFAGLAVKAGVNSAVASLWRVDDQATFALMMQFYHHLKSSPIKAEALRQAQIALLKGEMNIESGKLILGKDLKISLPTQLANLEDHDFSHPHYWAAFTMIGSPW